MFFVTQTNVPNPTQGMRMTLEQANEYASELCPNPGDEAVVYKLTKVATCRAIQTVEFEGNAAYNQLNAQYRGEDLASLMGDIE